MLLNTKLLGARTKALFRVVYILPWLFTVAIIAVLWRLLLSPNGVVNYLLLHDRRRVAGELQLGARPPSRSSTSGPATRSSWSACSPGCRASRATSTRRPRSTARAGWQRFFNVTIPQLRPIIISMALLDFIWTSQQFALIWMTTGGGPINATEMLSTFTYKLAFASYDFSLASTSAVLVLLLSMVLAVLLRAVTRRRGTDDGPEHAPRRTRPTAAPRGRRRRSRASGCSRSAPSSPCWSARSSPGCPVLWMLVELVQVEHRDLRVPAAADHRRRSRFDAYAAILADPTKLRFFINSYVVSIVGHAAHALRRDPRRVRVQPVRLPAQAGRSTSSSSACRRCRRSRCSSRTSGSW